MITCYNINICDMAEKSVEIQRTAKYWSYSANGVRVSKKACPLTCRAQKSKNITSARPEEVERTNANVADKKT